MVLSLRDLSLVKLYESGSAPRAEGFSSEEINRITDANDKLLLEKMKLAASRIRRCNTVLPLRDRLEINDTLPEEKNDSDLEDFSE